MFRCIYRRKGEVKGSLTHLNFSMYRQNMRKGAGKAYYFLIGSDILLNHFELQSRGDARKGKEGRCKVAVYRVRIVIGLSRQFVIVMEGARTGKLAINHDSV
jgi:hypothetical protein